MFDFQKSFGVKKDFLAFMNNDLSGCFKNGSFMHGFRKCEVMVMLKWTNTQQQVLLVRYSTVLYRDGSWSLDYLYVACACVNVMICCNANS